MTINCSPKYRKKPAVIPINDHSINCFHHSSQLKILLNAYSPLLVAGKIREKKAMGETITNTQIIMYLIINKTE